MDQQVFTARKRSPDNYQYAYMQTSLPSPDDEIVEGNDPEGILDGND